MAHIFLVSLLARWTAIPDDCTTSSASEMIAGRNLAGQVHIVTGGNSGIGLGAARAFAAARASVIILPHSARTGEAAVEQIRRETGNPDVTYFPIELADFSSVRTVASQIQSKVGAKGISSMSLNAASSIPPQPFTNDGFNWGIQVNVLGHALLTNLLLPTIRSATPPGRVVWVSSMVQDDGGCGFAKLSKNCTLLEELEHTLRSASKPTKGLKALGPYNIDSNYYLTKWLMAVLAAALARHEESLGTHVQSYAIHPGQLFSAMTERIALQLQTIRNLCRCKGPAIRDQPTLGCKGHCMRTNDTAASNIAYVATQALDRTLNGNYFDYHECIKCSGSRAARCTGESMLSKSSRHTPAYLNGVYRLVTSLTQGAAGHAEL